MSQSGSIICKTWLNNLDGGISRLWKKTVDFKKNLIWSWLLQELQRNHQWRLYNERNKPVGGNSGESRVMFAGYIHHCRIYKSSCCQSTQWDMVPSKTIASHFWCLSVTRISSHLQVNHIRLHVKPSKILEMWLLASLARQSLQLNNQTEVTPETHSFLCQLFYTILMEIFSTLKVSSPYLLFL